MIKKASIAAIVAATVVGTVVYNMSDAVVLPPKTLKLVWDYPYPRSNILFNVYECDRFLQTNVNTIVDTNTMQVVGYDTNVIFNWKTMKRVSTTTNLFYFFAPTNAFGLLMVKATNTLTKLESL